MTARSGMRVAVVIPCYHSSTTLGAALDALSLQTRCPDEIIVVNSSGDHETDLVAARYPQVDYVSHPSRLLPHAARNLGARRTRADLLVFTDPDCVAASDWLQRLIEAIPQGGSVVGGSMACGTRTWFRLGVHLCKFHGLLPGAPAGERKILPTANVAYPRRIWDAVGPFAASRFCGDASICWRASASGVSLRFEPAAQVAHEHEETALALLRQRFVRGREFAVERAAHENWSSARRTLYAAVSPLSAFWVTLRAGADAIRAGWAAAYLATVPIQFLGHLAWNAGESVGLLFDDRSSEHDQAAPP